MRNLLLLALILVLLGMVLANTSPAYACGGAFACADGGKFLRSVSFLSTTLMTPTTPNVVLLI